MSAAKKARLAALERQHLLPSADPSAMTDADLWRAVAESVRVLLQSHAWPDGLADLLQRVEADIMTEEDAQIHERITEAMIRTDMTADDLLRLVFNVYASV